MQRWPHFEKQIHHLNSGEHILEIYYGINHK